ncbi:MAG: heme-binding protein [Veillonella sp.]|nr:heme-binding protein [Veillonella sp.]
MSEEKKVVAQEAKTEVSEVKNTVDEAVITEQAVASMLATVGAEAKTSQPKADEGKPRQTKGTMVQRPVTAIGGGFPIVKNGVFLGGLGISGGTTAQDMAVGHGALRAAGLEQ